MKQVVFQENEQITWIDQRFYRVKDDIYVPSVTTLLQAYPKPAAFFEWLKENGKESDAIRDAAGEVGSNVHQAIERYDTGEPVEWADQYGKPQHSLMEWILICKYVEFYKKTNYELVCNEISYASKALGYGGTLDKVCRFNGKLWLIDNKTSNAIYDSFWLQLVAYKNLWEEHNPQMPIDHIGILHLKAATRTEGKGDAIQGVGWKLCLPEHPLAYYEDLLQATIKLWKAQNINAKPLNRVYPAILQKEVVTV